VILRGLTAVAFGVLAVAWPHMTRTTLTLLFGIYALMHAVLSILAAIGSRGQRGCLLLTTEGMVGLWAGLSTLRTSSASPMAFVFFVWGWAVITGVLRIAEAIRLRKEISGDVWLALSGLVTVLFGLMLALRPILGAIGLALFIAFFALIWGFIEILLGWELQSVRHGRPAGGA
jgi:uncharacterized membrane protein HdeD (DUF308 family)